MPLFEQVEISEETIRLATARARKIRAEAMANAVSQAMRDTRELVRAAIGTASA